MSGSLYIGVPLGIDGWEIIESLEHFTLFGEYRSGIEDAIRLLQEGQGCWQSHLSEDGEWSEAALQSVAEVRRLSFNIWQNYQRYGDDLARSIRWSVGINTESGVTDRQCVAALAMDRACRAIEVLTNWLADFDTELYAGSPDDVTALANESPALFRRFVEEVRHEHAPAECHARESSASLLSAAQGVLHLASMCDRQHMGATELTSLISEAVETALPRALREKHQQRASRGGKRGSETKRSEAAVAAGKTCETAREIKRTENNLTDSELVKLLADRLILSEPTVRTHLRTEGLYPPAKTYGKKKY